MPRTVLILGGTGEAVELAHRLALLPEYRTISSLAGRTRSPVRPPGDLRIGGFGGVVALARFIGDHGIGAVVDATHPYATRISANAAAACRSAKCPHLVLHRPPWRPEHGDRWRLVPDSAAAAAALAPGSRVLLTTGHQYLESFTARTDVDYVVRLVEPPADDLVGARIILARGPFAEAEERAFLEEHGITTLVTKNSGGDAGRTKLDAARDAGIEVVMIERPPPPTGEHVDTVDDVLDWLERRAG